MTGMTTASSQLSLDVCNASCYYQWTLTFRKLLRLCRINDHRFELCCGWESSMPSVLPALNNCCSLHPCHCCQGAQPGTEEEQALPGPHSASSALAVPIPPHAASSVLEELAWGSKYLEKSWKAAGKLAGQFTWITCLTALNPLRWWTARLLINCEAGRCSFLRWVQEMRSLCLLSRGLFSHPIQHPHLCQIPVSRGKLHPSISTHG